MTEQKPSNFSAAAVAALGEPTREEILRAMDPNIRDFIDPALPEFAKEYGRTKMHLMPKELKNFKAFSAQQRVVDGLKQKLSNLRGAGLTIRNVCDSTVDKSGDRANLFQTLQFSFCWSNKNWQKPKNDRLREHQPLPQIREGFVTRFNRTGEGEAIVASLNQMLDEIYALCVTDLESKIRAEEEKLSQMM